MSRFERLAEKLSYLEICMGRELCKEPGGCYLQIFESKNSMIRYFTLGAGPRSISIILSLLLNGYRKKNGIIQSSQMKTL
jgi:hypothetical protein